MAGLALMTIGGGALAAALMIGIGAACLARNGLRAYAKARTVAAHPVLVHVRDMSAIAASLQGHGEEIAGLVARAFAALERISQALAMLRDLFTRSSSRSDSEAQASRVRTAGN